MRIGLCGLSATGLEHHVPAIISTPGIELAAVASQHGGLDGVPWYPSLDALLTQELSIDAVAICSPPLRRQEEAVIALQAGRHVLLERPPAATLTQAGTLLELARKAGLTLMAAWPARLTPAVEAVRGLLRRERLEAAHLVWTEDARAWQSEEGWIWQHAGFGVFHGAIDGLSILNRVSADRLAVSAATLHIAPDREAPVAAELTFRAQSGLVVDAVFDVRPGVRRQWTLEMRTEPGPMLLDQHGTTLLRNGRVVPTESAAPYRAVYQRFLLLAQSGTCDVDTGPLRQVADALLVGRRVPTDPLGPPSG